MLLREAPDRLNADLQREFGVCLTDMYEGRARVPDIADFAVNRSRGGAVDRWFGGWGAISGEEEALTRVEYAIVAVNAGKKKPPPPVPPKGLRDAVLNQQRKAKAQANKAKALASMQAVMQQRMNSGGVSDGS